MHIIVLENEPSSLRGGQELSLLDVCRGLHQRGHTISLIYLREGNLLEQYYEICTSIVNVNSYLIEKNTPIASTFNFLADTWKINSKIPKSKNSIIYCNQHYDTFFGAALALSKSLPLVCHLRLPAPQEFHRQCVIGMKGVKQFITISNQTKIDWIKSGLQEKKIDVVYNGINTEIFKPLDNLLTARKQWNIPEDTKVISYVGRLDTYKGVETLIKAFALLLKIDKNMRLLIAGKPIRHATPEEGEKYKQSLHQLSTDLGIEKYVDFLGHVTNTISLYQVSDVTVLPSLWAEPFGRTIIESMACGTPVVASRTGGIPEILTGEFQSGLFEPGNEQSLSDTLSSMMNWRDRNPEFSERCREHILNKFSLDRNIACIEKVLLKVVNS